MIEVGEAVGPSHWAVALINGDTSGLDDREEAYLNAWVERLSRDGWHVSSVRDEEEPWFTWNYRIYSGDHAGPSGGDVVTYVIFRSSS